MTTHRKDYKGATAHDGPMQQSGPVQRQQKVTADVADKHFREYVKRHGDSLDAFGKPTRNK